MLMTSTTHVTAHTIETTVETVRVIGRKEGVDGGILSRIKRSTGPHISPQKLSLYDGVP